jgi:hypothetical protein
MRKEKRPIKKFEKIYCFEAERRVFVMKGFREGQGHEFLRCTFADKSPPSFSRISATFSHHAKHTMPSFSRIQPLQ